MAICVAILGKDNAPKYFICANPEEELTFQFKVHAALDIIEEKLGSKSAADSKELYLGQLTTTEKYKIYGYVTNTKAKLVVAVDASNPTLRESDIKAMLTKLHEYYIDAVCNPFYSPGMPINLKNFDTKIRKLMVPWK